MNNKIFLSSTLFLLMYFGYAKPANANCPSEINSDNVTITQGSVCVIPENTTYIFDKVDSETSSINSAELRIEGGGTLTISNGASLKTGTLIPDGGNLIIQDGGSITIGGNSGGGLWVVDADADGYAADFTTYTATATGRRRVGLMKSKTNPDCNDANISRWQNLAGYTDSDGDGYGTGGVQQICSGNSLLAGYAVNSSDCNDAKYSPNNIACIVATGGTITTISGYRVHTFTSSGTFTVTSGSGTSQALIVGGGGNGRAGQAPTSRSAGGGGGGGQVKYLSNQSLSTTSYSVVVGSVGGNSSFAGTTSLKGNNGTQTGGTSGSSHAGGAAFSQGGGGGGGDSANGTAAYNGGSGNDNGGTGGTGTASSINGTNIIYGSGGGGGGGTDANTIASVGGAGGSGAGTGGTCAYGGGSVTGGGAATANRGGGGGGGGACYSIAGAAGAGASGVVIIRYPWE